MASSRSRKRGYSSEEGGESTRRNAPAVKQKHGAVNACARDYASFKDIGGSVNGSGWEGGSSSPSRGTPGGDLGGGSSKDDQEGG